MNEQHQLVYASLQMLLGGGPRTVANRKVEILV